MFDKQVRQFKYHMGYQPDLKDPKTFSEKLFLRKMLDRRELLVQCTDKLRAKGWVRGLTDARPVPTSHVGMDWEYAETPFIAKPNNYSGETYLVTGAEQWEQVRKRFKEIKAVPYGQDKYQWAYSQVPFKVMIEPFIDFDYEFKLFCFDGKCRVIRLMGENKSPSGVLAAVGTRSHFLPDGTFLQVEQKNHPIGQTRLPEEVDMQAVIRAAEGLSEDIDFVRMDLFWHRGTIYYGEHTVYPASGHCRWNPQSFDQVLGEFWNLPGFLRL